MAKENVVNPFVSSFSSISSKKVVCLITHNSYIFFCWNHSFVFELFLGFFEVSSVQCVLFFFFVLYMRKNNCSLALKLNKCWFKVNEPLFVLLQLVGVCVAFFVPEYSVLKCFDHVQLSHMYYLLSLFLECNSRGWIQINNLMRNIVRKRVLYHALLQNIGVNRTLPDGFLLVFFIFIFVHIPWFTSIKHSACTRFLEFLGVLIWITCELQYKNPMPPQRVTVWCVLWSGGISGPFFFEMRLETTFWLTVDFIEPCYIEDMDLDNLWFMQDGAPCHTARVIVDLLHTKFPNRVIGRLGDVN